MHSQLLFKNGLVHRPLYAVKTWQSACTVLYATRWPMHCFPEPAYMQTLLVMVNYKSLMSLHKVLRLITVKLLCETFDATEHSTEIPSCILVKCHRVQHEANVSLTRGQLGWFLTEHTQSNSWKLERFPMTYKHYLESLCGKLGQGSQCFWKTKAEMLQ